MQRHAGSGGLLRQLAGDVVEDRQHRLGAERDDARAGLELGEEEHLVDQLADRVDLAPRLLDERRHVLARETRELEQREQPSQRRPQLVRDRGREAGAELLVRGEVAGLGEVDEPLGQAADAVRDDERRTAALAAQERLRQQLAFADPFERLPRAPARRDHAILVVEHDHRLAALLDDHPAAQRVALHVAVVTDGRSPPRYHSFTHRQRGRAA